MSQSAESDVIRAAKVASIRILNARSAREITEADARACAEAFLEVYMFRDHVNSPGRVDG